MRILYGIAGDGLGHAVRSAVVIAELVGQHEVRLVASSGAYDYLSERFPAQHEVWELTTMPDSGPHEWETAVSELTAAVSRWPAPAREVYRRALAFKPDVVITDCESFATLFALRHSLPLISIDHIHAIDRCRHDPGLLRGHEGDLWTSRQMVGTKVPNAAHYVITTFYYPLLLEPRTTLVPPILRPEILAARPERGDHLLVYQSTPVSPRLTEALAASGCESLTAGLTAPGSRVECVESIGMSKQWSATRGTPPGHPRRRPRLSPWGDPRVDPAPRRAARPAPSRPEPVASPYG